MKSKPTSEQTDILPTGKFCSDNSQPTREHLSSNQSTYSQSRASKQPQRHLHLLTASPVEDTFVAAPYPSLRTQPRTKGHGRQDPRPFSYSCGSNPLAVSMDLEPLRRETVNQEKGGDEFHDGRSDDLYDLYNACNGVLCDGVLDIRKLDELSPDEAEFLDIPRLREIWEHISSGCLQCQAIIKTLNSARESLRKRAAEHG